MRLCFIALVLAGCSAHDAGEPVDLAPPADMTPAAPPPVAAPAGPYAGDITVPSKISVDYAGTSTTALVGAVHVTDGVGTIDFQGSTYPALAYEHIPFGTYDLAAIVATTESGVVVTYAYCMGGVLDDLYTESLMLAPTDEMSAPMGTCSFADTSTTLAPAFAKPAMLSYDWPTDVADVDGAQLTIHGGTGVVTIAGTSYDVDVFTSVDCSTCGGTGWRELHATIGDAQTLAFAIFYLEAAMPGQVLLAYGVRFDEPALWPPTQTFSAAWSLK